MSTGISVLRIALFLLALVYAITAMFTKDKVDGRYLIVMAHLTLIVAYVLN